jgi:hypothetical protein
VNETETRIQQELVAIVDVLTEMTGLASRWSGEVELSQDPRIMGRKPFSCRIIVNAGLVDQSARWRTLIHEAMHSLSAGYNMTDYQAFLGWEEGVVEQTQRLLRPIVLERLGVQVDSSVFSSAESAYSFNKYIRAIELLRNALGREDEQEFYLTLLATEIKRRHNLIFSLGNRLPGLQRIAFMAVFSEANSILKDSP